MAFVVLFPAFEFVDLDKTLVNDFIVLKNLPTMLGDVRNVFLCKFKIFFCTVVEVCRFSDEHSAHFIGHVLLPATETRKRYIACKTLPLKEFD